MLHYNTQKFQFVVTKKSSTIKKKLMYVERWNNPLFSRKQPKYLKGDFQKFIKTVTFASMVFNKEFIPNFISHT